MNFTYNFPLIILINFVFLGGIGALLSLDGFLDKFNPSGKWKVSIPKLTILGIPSLVFALIYLWIGLVTIPDFIIMNIKELLVISNIVLGHTIMSSISKE